MAVSILSTEDLTGIHQTPMIYGSNLKVDVIMKKMSIIFAAFGLFSAASCSKVNINESQRDLVPLSIYSGEKVSQNPALKTALDGTAVVWTADDEVAVFDKSDNINKFSAVSISGSKASFEGLVEVGTTEFYAVYPYVSAVSADASALYLQLPADQTSAAGTFAEEVNVSVAKGVRTQGETHVSGVKFNNICGLIHFTVPEHLSAVSEVVFTADNRSLAGKLTVSKSSTPSVTAVADGTSSLSMSGSFSAGSTFYFVAAPGLVDGFNIRVKTANGAVFSKTSTASFDLAAGGMKNLGVIDFKPEFSTDAEHVYSNGVLTGTHVNVAFGLPAGMEDYVESVEVKVLNGSGTVVRQYSSNSAAATLTLDKTHGNVYLPQGKYQVAYTYVMNGVAKTVTKDITVPAPVFTGTVSVSGVTSYSLSKTNVNAANDYPAEQIGSITASCTAVSKISSEVLQQYPVSYSISLDGKETIFSGSTTSSTVSPGAKSGAAWGTHTLTSSFSFDGLTISGTSDKLYITGLPYISTLTKNTTGWTNFNNVETDSKCFIFNTDAASVLSPRFSFSDGVSVNIKTTLNVYAYHTNATAEYKPKVYVNASSTPVHEAKGASASVSSSIAVMDIGGVPVDKSFDLTMSSSAANLSIYVYGKKNKGWLNGADYPEFFIKKCTVLYR